MSDRKQRPILITGSHGQLGRSLVELCTGRGMDFEGRDIDTLDISDQSAVTRWIEEARPGAVINCAAFTAVDDCESNEELAQSVNGNAVGHLASACNAVGARLVQISTDYVFAGDGVTPYNVDDPVSPVSAYGRTKLAGEELARTARDHLVVRTAWLYGHGGRNFVEAIRDQIEAGTENLKVVADQQGCPTFCNDLAGAILDLLSIGTGGIVHAVNTGATTWHGFAVAIAECLGADAEILPVRTEEFPRPAPRPQYSVLDTSRLEAELGRSMPTWRDALQRYLEKA
jgi:dTDP-4-dehydrorhamnose reductase